MCSPHVYNIPIEYLNLDDLKGLFTSIKEKIVLFHQLCLCYCVTAMLIIFPHILSSTVPHSHPFPISFTDICRLRKCTYCILLFNYPSLYQSLSKMLADLMTN